MATTALGEDALKAAIDALDFDAIARSFRAKDELVFIERFLPPEALQPLVEEAQALLPLVHRSWTPFWRKGGAISQLTIRERAPRTQVFARSPAMLAFAQRLTGRVLEHKSDQDPHAHALYYYQKKGDWVGWHYDACGCDETASYTATLGLTNNTRSRVIYRVFEKQEGRAVAEESCAMVPGSLVFFCGSKANHCVTPLEAGEDRIALSFTFVEQGRHKRGAPGFGQNLVDAFAYFGLSTLFKK